MTDQDEREFSCCEVCENELEDESVDVDGEPAHPECGGQDLRPDGGDVQDVPRGCECEKCDPEISGCELEDAPVAKVVKRDGKRIRVCTRCDLTSDRVVEVLIDGDTPVAPYFEYDSLGALALGLEAVDDGGEVDAGA